MNKFVQHLLLFCLILCFVQGDRQSDQIKKVPIQLYNGSISVSIQNGQDISLQYVIALSSTPQKCSQKLCYLGWVQSYTAGGQTFQGYPNQKQRIQPIFNWAGNSTTDYSLTYQKNLDIVWRQIIELWAERFNPFVADEISSCDNQNNPKRELYQKANIQVNDTDFSRARFFKRAQYDDKKLLKAQADSFNFALSSQTLDEQIDAGDSADQDVTGNIQTALDSNSTSLPQSIVQNVRDLLKKDTSSYHLRDIQRIRATQSAGNFTVNQTETDQQPKIDLDEINQQRDQISDINPNRYFQDPSSYATYDNRDIFRQVQPFTQTISSNAIISTEKDDKNRFLPVIAKYTLISYTKLLFSKKIFGKVNSVTVEVKCYLSIQTTGHFVQCRARLLYVVFGQSKSLNIYYFKKSIAASWSWSKTYQGTWAAKVTIPLPPPVSFITIHLYFGVKYWITISLYAKPILWFYPFRYQARAVIETGIDTQARASIRVVAIEGGVFLKGTLVKVGTDPTVTLSYYWWQKKIQIYICWYFWLHAFEYKWGFFWRYWRLFKGWSGIKIIKQWTISNGLYRKWLIYKYSWIIYP